MNKTRLATAISVAMGLGSYTVVSHAQVMDDVINNVGGTVSDFEQADTITNNNSVSVSTTLLDNHDASVLVSLGSGNTSGGNQNNVSALVAPSVAQTQVATTHDNVINIQGGAGASSGAAGGGGNGGPGGVGGLGGDGGPAVAIGSGGTAVSLTLALGIGAGVGGTGAPGGAGGNAGNGGAGGNAGNMGAGGAGGNANAGNGGAGGTGGASGTVTAGATAGTATAMANGATANAGNGAAGGMGAEGGAAGDGGDAAEGGSGGNGGTLSFTGNSIGDKSFAKVSGVINIAQNAGFANNLQQGVVVSTTTIKQ